VASRRRRCDAGACAAPYSPAAAAQQGRALLHEMGPGPCASLSSAIVWSLRLYHSAPRAAGACKRVVTARPDCRHGALQVQAWQVQALSTSEPEQFRACRSRLPGRACGAARSSSAQQARSQRSSACALAARQLAAPQTPAPPQHAALAPSSTPQRLLVLAAKPVKHRARAAGTSCTCKASVWWVAGAGVTPRRCQCASTYLSAGHLCVDRLQRVAAAARRAAEGRGSARIAAVLVMRHRALHVSHLRRRSLLYSTSSKKRKNAHDRSIGRHVGRRRSVDRSIGRSIVSQALCHFLLPRSRSTDGSG